MFTKEIGIVTLILFFEFLATILLVPGATMTRYLQEERNEIVRWHGQKGATELIRDTDGRFNRFFVVTNLVDSSYSIYVPSEKNKDLRAVDPVFEFVQSRLETFWGHIYQVMTRFSLAVTWLPFLLPLFVPAVIDGLAVRKIKTAVYGYASPNRYHLSFHILRYAVYAIPLFLFFPWPLTPMSIFVWALVVTGALRLLTSNLQKML